MIWERENRAAALIATHKEAIGRDLRVVFSARHDPRLYGQRKSELLVEVVNSLEVVQDPELIVALGDGRYASGTVALWHSTILDTHFRKKSGYYGDRNDETFVSGMGFGLKTDVERQKFIRLDMTYGVDTPACVERMEDDGYTVFDAEYTHLTVATEPSPSGKS